MESKHISLGELAIKLKINKSKLMYWTTLGLLTPIATVGRMNIFDEVATLKAIKDIKSQKKIGKKLKEIKS